MGSADYMRALSRAVGTLTIEATKPIDAVGDTVLAQIVQHGKGRASGDRRRQPLLPALHLPGGKNRADGEHHDEGEALEAVGLSERRCRRRTWRSCAAIYASLKRGDMKRGARTLRPRPIEFEPRERTCLRRTVRSWLRRDTRGRGRASLASFERLRFERHELIDAGDTVVVLASGVAAGAARQRRSRSTGACPVVDVRKGKVISSSRLLRTSEPKPSKPWACRSKTLTPTPEPAGYCAGDVAGERGARSTGDRRPSTAATSTLLELCTRRRVDPSRTVGPEPEASSLSRRQGDVS